MHPPNTHLLAALTLLLAPTTHAITGPDLPPSNTPPKVAPTLLENFTWTNPFSPSSSHPIPSHLLPSCTSTRTFPAATYLLHDLSTAEPLGLLPYREPLINIFKGRAYPGSWDGVDAHGYERDLLRMEYADVPVQVREWIEGQERAHGPGKGLFAVFAKPGIAELEAEVADKIVIFAPGALYETLPLWLVQDSGCEGTLMDLSKYSAKIVDGGVVGWPTEHTEPEREAGHREMSFTLKAQVLSSEASTPDMMDQDKGRTEPKDEL